MGDDTRTQEPAVGPESEQWRKYLMQGHSVYRLLRGLFRLAPSSPRCATCYAPFAGVGGKIFGLTPFTQSKKAPRFCKLCCESQPAGGAEVTTGVLFADMRGYTSMAEQMAPHVVARGLNRFYAYVSDVLVAHDALIDKMVGDQVMALFLPGFTAGDYIDNMVSAAETLARAARAADDPWLRIGVGLDHGLAWVGNIGEDKVLDFTALGDVINTAARLQARAEPGEVFMSERVYEHVARRYPEAAQVELALKGKSDAVLARRVTFDA